MICKLKLEIGNLEEISEIGGKLEIRGKNWKLGKNIRNLEMNLGWKMIIGNILDICK